MAVIDNIPDPVKETYLRIRSDHGKKLELKFIGGNYYLYIAKGVWDKKYVLSRKCSGYKYKPLILPVFLMAANIILSLFYPHKSGRSQKNFERYCMIFPKEKT